MITLLFIVKRRQTRTVRPKAHRCAHRWAEGAAHHPSYPASCASTTLNPLLPQNSEHGTFHKEWNFAPIGLYGFAILDECFSLQAI